MIIDFKNERTEVFSAGERVREFSGFERRGWKRLEILDAATSLEDLRALPSNREGLFGIRIDLQWRTCFEWPAGAIGPPRVEIVDYH